jgi:hypothetical protein
MMTILVAMLLGLIGGAISFFLGAAAASVIASATHMSNMEGARGYFAVAIGLLTGIVGMIVTMALTVRWRGAASFAGGLGTTLASLGGLVLLAAAGVGIYYISIPHPIHRNGPPVYLKFEIAPPPGGTAPNIATWEVELDTDKNVMNGYWDRDTRGEQSGRSVVSGRVELYYRTSQRMLVMKMPDREARIFRLRLPADPTAARFRQWSEWRKADFADSPGQNGPTAKAQDYQVRYLIETNVEP